MTVTALAGTFNILHDGHKRLIARAFELGNRVFVGLTDDIMAAASRTDIIPYYLRYKALDEYLKTFEKPYSIESISDMYGPREIMDGIDILVVSVETQSNAEELNRERASRGVRPFRIEAVDLEMSDSGEKISSSSILSGRYGRDGNSNSMDIIVGSANHVKIEAVRTVMERIYGSVRVSGIDVDSGVPPQPFEEQTRQGAMNRAKAALGDHDIAVGIEAGVFEKVDGLYDFQYCAILDRDGVFTIGTGMGFKYPDSISKLVRSGSTVGDAVRTVYGDTDIGKKQGAIGLLSRGLIDRKGLTEQSVTAAMVPRLWEE